MSLWKKIFLLYEPKKTLCDHKLEKNYVKIAIPNHLLLTPYCVKLKSKLEAEG